MVKVLIAGGSGFIGRHLVQHLKKQGYSVSLLSRTMQIIDGFDECIIWQEVTTAKIIQFDVVINLCGFGIGEKRWCKSIKEKILSSRIEPTERLIKHIADHDVWLINASAIGYYPFSLKEQNETEIIQRTKANSGFCQYIVNQWEAVVNRSRLRRKTIVRFGVVLGKGGMLSKLLPTAKVGLAATIGNGQQIMSWVHIDDLCRAMVFILEQQCINIEINMTSDNACSQKVFIKTMAKVLNKPCFLVLPQWLVRLIFGQMGKELLLSSHNIKPMRLQDAGFIFDYPHIETALIDLLK
ncbi:TIGR01777 family oxidoreductase [Cysteiniphilum halobium]|uniref:TIGR01777 family oxidoreductase n=1 Tax=Cysteiniphilum halobium TaxID=2219059 RepID=UPI000E648457|nr:TIGR01777 family oxidoreductase [Cysteiniphilum halobium]